jgi:hypothetical protein
MRLFIIARRIPAPANDMRLTNLERERLSDGMLKIQSVRASLEQVDMTKIPQDEDIRECLESVDQSLREALGYGRPKPGNSSES